MVMERKRYSIFVTHFPKAGRVHGIVGNAFMKLPNDEDLDVDVQVRIGEFEGYRKGVMMFELSSRKFAVEVVA
jgi:hypothetical protein